MALLPDPAPHRPGFAARLRGRLVGQVAGRSRGQSLVEFALLLPVLMLFFATTLDLGRLAAAQLAVANAAKEGAFQAAVTPTDFDPTQPCPSSGASNLVRCRIELELRGSGITVNPADVAITCSQSGCPKSMGSRVTVTLTGRFELLTPVLAPLLGGTNVAFTRSATAQLEALPAPETAGPVATATPTPTPSPTSEPTGSESPSPTPTSVACVIPSAGFTYSASPNSKQAPVTLTVNDTTTSPSCAITSWFWEWGDGSTSMLQHPGSHLYLAKGTYFITLTVANAAGTDTTGALQLVVK